MKQPTGEKILNTSAQHWQTLQICLSKCTVITYNRPNLIILTRSKALIKKNIRQKKAGNKLSAVEGVIQNQSDRLYY